VLLDYGDVVVHVFTSDTRRFYDIERLYRDVPQRRFSSAPMA
jgi:ribosome-associated protein